MSEAKLARAAVDFARSAFAAAGLALLSVGFAFAAAGDGLRPATVNAKPEARVAGKFIWFDCVTADTYGSKAFYGVVFNWDFHSIGSGPGRYTLIENKGRNIGGMHFRPRDKGGAQGSRWLSLLSTISTIGRTSANVRVSKDY